MAKKRKKKKKKAVYKYIVIGASALAAIALFCLVCLYRMAYSLPPEGPATVITIPKNATNESISDSLTSNLGDYGKTVYRLWCLRGGEAENASGVYVVADDDKAWSLASRIKDGRSSAIKVTFNNIRLLSDLAETLSRNFLWDADDFLAACDSILPTKGFKKEEFAAAFLPDTYEFYASAEASQVVSKLLDHRNHYWNEERRERAKELGLTPVKVAVIASIVEEESNNRDERPAIARLYMNRLEQNMPLQADPTVKFALGDFSLKRIYNHHTQVESPYNTYRVKGLPPGPIRIAERSTLDAVLNAPDNDYLYMCAKPGGVGTHNFSRDYAEHLRNARAYQQWLDSINIK